MNNKRLQHAVTLALVSAGMMALSSNVSAAQVYYNKFNADVLDIGKVDGTPTNGTFEFTGLGAGVAPFGYAGSAPVNWAVHLAGQNDSAVVSSAEALINEGIAADVDTAIGAWNDGKYTSYSGSMGWIHQTDEALIKSDVTQYVTISLTGATVAPHGNYNAVNTNWVFGISIFEGMDTSAYFDYSFHDSWNDGYCPASAPECTTPTLGRVTAIPGYAEGLTFKTFGDNSSVTFLAEAGSVYSVFLGGNNVGHMLTPVAEYQATITTSAVPIPAAAWLFGSGLLTFLGSLGRQRKTLNRVPV